MTAALPSSRLLLGLLLASVVSTSLHFPHNFVYADDYPPVLPFFPNSLAYRIGIAVFYPLLTAAAVWGYRLFSQGRTAQALPFLGAYSLLGFTSIFHYVGGVPQVPVFFTATIYTDFLAGSAIIWFVVVADRARRAGQGRGGARSTGRARA